MITIRAPQYTDTKMNLRDSKSQCQNDLNDLQTKITSAIVAKKRNSELTVRAQVDAAACHYLKCIIRYIQ